MITHLGITLIPRTHGGLVYDQTAGMRRLASRWNSFHIYYR